MSAPERSLAVAGARRARGVSRPQPGMGWLFAVALGLHRQTGASCGCRCCRSRWATRSPLPLVTLAFLWAGLVVDGHVLRTGAGLVLIGWALYHWRYGHRHRVRFGMQVGTGGAGRVVLPHGDRAWRRPDAVAGAHAAVFRRRQPARRRAARPRSPASACIRWRCWLVTGASPSPSTNGSAWRSCAAPGSTSTSSGPAPSSRPASSC